MDLTMFFAEDETGAQVLADRPRAKGRAAVERLLALGGSEADLTALAELAIATEQWRWFDAYQAWQAQGEALTAKVPEQARDEQGAFVADDPDTPEDEAWLEGYSPEVHQAALAVHVATEPRRPAIPTVADYLAGCANWDHWRKRQGVEFEGQLCSATKEDMWGLASIEGWIRAGATTDFRFDNGTVLTLTPDNLDAFQAVWTPFRAGFFS